MIHLYLLWLLYWKLLKNEGEVLQLIDNLMALSYYKYTQQK